MRTIAFVTQKGGSGKSTLAACLAVAAHEKGERVFLIDTDPLMSLSKWAKGAQIKGYPGRVGAGGQTAERAGHAREEGHHARHY